MDHYIHTLESCTLNFAFSAISGKWKPYILWYLHSAPGGVCRYGELKRLVPYDISHKIFTQQLQELESYNIIKRTEYDEKPKRVEYSLTEPGKLLLPVILYMRDWGILASKDCQPGAIERTHGQPQGSTIHYGYRSEELDKSVSIAFQWGEPVQPVTDDGGAAQTQERSDE
jgi:DNA-binding HxlR family transcriptional regulator